MAKLAGLVRRLDQGWIARGIAALAYLYYGAQSWGFMHTRRAILDEGLYLVKGYFFATGRFWPFQDYGFWTNHMPLSFVIPGYIEKWFGPGYREGRYFFFLLGLISVLGLWLAAKRLGGDWWATFAVGAVALNPAWIKLHSVALSYGLITFFGVWMLVFMLGEDRKIWELCLASVLAGLMLMTRINVAPIFPLLILYIWWQHGKKAALWAGLSGAVVVGLVHAIYWPGILRMWAFWIPEGLIPALEPWYSPAKYSFSYTARDPFFPLSAWIGDVKHDNWAPVRSFWTAIRQHILPFTGVLLAVLLWPNSGKGKSSSYRTRLAVFFSGSYLLLLTIHAWAALTARSCTYWCFGNYLYFFYLYGLLLIIVCAPLWEKRLSWWRQAIIFLAVLLLLTGIGIGASDEFANGLLSIPIRMSTDNSTGELWSLFASEYGWERVYALRALPPIFGFVAAFLYLLVVVPGLLWLTKSRGKTSWGWVALVVILVSFYVLSPTTAFGGQAGGYDCGGDVLSGYEAAGEELRKTIEPGARIYLGTYSAVHLFYLPDALIYPPQLNHSGFYNQGQTSSDQLLKFGFWNKELKQEWIAEADYILVEARWYEEDFKDQVEAGEFQILTTTPITEVCRGDGSRVIVLIPTENPGE